MNFNEIYQAAMDVVNYTAASRNGILDPGTTICVLVSATGRVYNGVSRPNVHAEVEAVRNMQAYGENAVTTLILVDANTRLAMLPCPNCMNYILTLNQVNYNAVVAMPDRPVPFGEIIQNNSVSVSMQFNSGQMSRSAMSAQVSSMVISGRASGGVMKDKVGGLLKAASELEDDEDDDLLDELREAAREKEKKEGKKGLFGGLFGKK